MYCDGDTTCDVLTIPISTSAPPLTVGNVLKNLHGLKNGWEVGKWLLGYSESKVGAIQRKYNSNEKRLKAAVKQWLEGGGRSRQSWRLLVWSLDQAGDIVVADPIRGFTEPPPGESS